MKSSIRMLETALEMEEKGKEFYEKAISNCTNALGKDIFTTLMKDEIVHLDRIKSIYESLKNDNTWSMNWQSYKEDHGDLKLFFKNLAVKHGGNITADTKDLEALDIGIDFEAKSVKYYKEALSKSNDPLEKAFLEKMVDEENLHHFVLSDLKFYLSDPTGWFTEQEHHGLDGV
jgi:rubrerythrin